jgi:hypothetical protein
LPLRLELTFLRAVGQKFLGYLIATNAESPYNRLYKTANPRSCMLNLELNLPLCK